MKLMRLAMCLAIFAVVGGKAMSEEYIDISALQAKLAAQEARLNDLQAKMGSSKDDGGTAKNITSLRKNAKVTIGGEMDVRYNYVTGNVKSKYRAARPTVANGANPNGGNFQPGTAGGVNTVAGDYRKVLDTNTSNFYVDTAKMRFKIDVNEYFDAFIRLDLHDTARTDVSGIAQAYWIRWKNVCNTGFGLLIGRDGLKYGGIPGKVGALDVVNQDDGTQPFTSLSQFEFTRANNYGDGMFLGHGFQMRPATVSWGRSRTTQISPYWESQDGKVKVETSFFQSLDRRNGTQTWNEVRDDNARYYRSANYGVGSMSGRITLKPIEDLTVWISAINLRKNRNAGPWHDARSSWGTHTDGATDTAWTYNYDSTITGWSKNNFAINGGFSYNPCFFKKLTVWADFQQDWNARWVKDLDVFSMNYGASVKLTDQLTWFGQGDFFSAKNHNSDRWNKGTGWAAYTGLKYTLPYGVFFEGGWKHEQATYKDRAGDKHTKAKADIVYGMVGFEF